MVRCCLLGLSGDLSLDRVDFQRKDEEVVVTVLSPWPLCLTHHLFVGGDLDIFAAGAPDSHVASFSSSRPEGLGASLSYLCVCVRALRLINATRVCRC